jgi:hypothetical protein
VGVRALLKKENTLEELVGLVQQVLAGRGAEDLRRAAPARRQLLE